MNNYKEVIFSHDEYNMCVVGDIVMCDRLPYNVSNKKSFSLTKILVEADRYKDHKTGITFTVPAMNKFKELCLEAI